MAIHRANLFPSIRRNETGEWPCPSRPMMSHRASAKIWQFRFHGVYRACPDVQEQCRKQCCKGSDNSTVASCKTSCPWYRKPSINVNMTSVCGPWEHTELCLKEPASVQSNLRNWKKTSWLVSSMGFWKQVPRQVTHVRKMLFLPMAAWLHAMYHETQQERKGNHS